MDDDRTVHTAANAFHLISDEFRIAILDELGRSGDALKFSELLDALDDPDSGRLNYHLSQLTGTYVAKVEGKYQLTIQGAKVISSILASRYVDDDAQYSTPAEGRCYDCGATALRLEQTGQQAVVRCRDCAHKQFRKSVTTALWKHREPADIPRALDRIVWSELELAVDRVCEYCRSTMEPRVAENRGQSNLYRFYDLDVLAVYECELCTNWKLAPYGLVAWLHPEVRSFHREHGIDPDVVNCWQIEQGIDPAYTSVVSADPYEIDVRFPTDAAECRVTFDDRNEVVRVVREWSD